MDTQKDKRSSRLKGSVLYTVTLVMMVMLILMMSAIALAGTANKRAFGEYHDDQTTYTGRSVIDSVVSTLDKAGPDGNAAIGEYIKSQINANHDNTVVINVNNKEALPGGYGTVEKLEFKYAGIDKEGDFYISGSGNVIIKVTATVKMGNETTTYSEYLSGNQNNDSPPSGGAGFLAAGGLNLDASTSSGLHGPSYTETFPTFLSPLTWPDPYGEEIVTFRNPVHISGGGLYGSTAAFTTSNARITFARNVSGSNGFTVMGNLALMNEINILSGYTPVNTDSITNIPYIYCGGTFYIANKINVGSSSNTNPINIYCGRVVFDGNDSSLSSSIYCYNSDASYVPGVLQSSLTYTVPSLSVTSDGKGIVGDKDVVNNQLDGTSSVSIIGFTNTSPLIDWASSAITNKQLHSGSVYTKGSLKLGATGKNAFNINGDVYVDQILDMRDSATGSTISGDICVNGQLMINNATDFMTILSHNLSSEVKCRAITDSSGTVLSDADFPGYNVKIDPAVAAFTWPAGMSKDDILGKNNKDDKIIATHDDAFGKFYDIDKGKYKRSINESRLQVSGESKIYYYDSSANEVKMRTVSNPTAVSVDKTSIDITESCTFVGGTFSECTFNITPDKDKQIWINLYDVKFENCDMIADDSKNREVYFYIPQEDNFSLSPSPLDSNYFSAISAVSGTTRTSSTPENTFYANNTHFLTKNYHETYFGKGKSLVEDLNLVTYYKKADDKPQDNELGKNLVPDLYICSADNKAETNVVFDNQCVLTGHLITLNSRLSWANSSHTHNGSNFSYTLSGSTEADAMASTNITAIGSVFVKGASQLQNNFEFYYVDYLPESKGEGIHDEKILLTPIDGYVSY